MTPLYESLRELHQEVLPTLPADWHVHKGHMNDARQAAAYWLLAHLNLGQRLWPHVRGEIDVPALLEATDRLSSTERILVLYAAHLAAPEYPRSAGYDIPGPATVARLLNHTQGEMLEAALAMANGRRHPAVQARKAAG